MGMLCLCDAGYDPKKFMIECFYCQKWFHGTCVNITEEKALNIAKYACNECSGKGCSTIYLSNEPSPLRRQFADMCSLNVSSMAKNRVDNICKHKMSDAFRTLLHSGMYAKSGVKRMKSIGLSSTLLKNTGFRSPLLILEPSHLNIRLPRKTIEFNDLSNLIGLDQLVKYVDVDSQIESLLSSSEWIQRYADIKEGLNLEFQIHGTALEEDVIPPQAVRDIDWFTLIARQRNHLACTFSGPKTYKDFKINPGGTSSWHYALSGWIWFYLIPPTKHNIKKFDEWQNSPEKEDVFFPDLVDSCIKCDLTSNSMLMLPSGWMYATFSPSESFSIYGLFQHGMTINTQIQVYENEIARSSISLWMKINPEETFWHAVNYFNDILNSNHIKDDNFGISFWEKHGLYDLITVLKSWIKIANPLHKIPNTIESPFNLLENLKQTLDKVKHIPERDLDEKMDISRKLDKCEGCGAQSNNNCICSEIILEYSNGSGKKKRGRTNKKIIKEELNNHSLNEESEETTNDLKNDITDLSWIHSHVDIEPLDSIWCDSMISNNNHVAVDHHGLGINIGLDPCLDDSLSFALEDGLFSYDQTTDEVQDTSSPSTTDDQTFNCTSVSDHASSAKHRASCHRCGNLRKKNIRCPKCPHIFCQKCAEKMISEHGNEAFTNGCPVCKELCCCGPNRSVDCQRKYHCYKKCPSTKKNLGGCGVKVEKDNFLIKKDDDSGSSSSSKRSNINSTIIHSPSQATLMEEDPSSNQTSLNPNIHDLEKDLIFAEFNVHSEDHSLFSVSMADFDDCLGDI